MRKPIFCPIEPPGHLAALAVNRHATWHTWSPAFRSFLIRAADELEHFPPPPTLRLKQLSTYDYTFSLPSTEWKEPALGRQLAEFAESLAATRPAEQLMLFDGLLGPDLDGKRLHVLFALLRGALAELAGDDFAAMYTPLGNTGDYVGDFLLHADLYVPEYLFNVFDNVPAKNGGASTFLTLSSLRRIVAQQTEFPAARAQSLFAMFEGNSKSDRFEKCFDLLHGTHRWVPQLEKSLAEHQLEIPLRSGQGYLLHDRSWLHGRHKPYGGVAPDRIRRLVYGI